MYDEIIHNIIEMIAKQYPLPLHNSWKEEINIYDENLSQNTKSTSFIKFNLEMKRRLK